MIQASPVTAQTVYNPLNDVFFHSAFLSRCRDQVKEEMLFEALTTRKTVTVGEKLIVPYKLAEVRQK